LNNGSSNNLGNSGYGDGGSLGEPEQYTQRFLITLDERFRDIEDAIHNNQKLLKEYENKRLGEADPKELKKIEINIIQIQKILNSSREEYVKLINYSVYVRKSLSSSVSQDLKSEISITRQSHETEPD